MNRLIPRIGIGGPVGSGKTALIEALVPLLLEQHFKPVVITNDIFTQEDAQHVRRTLAGVLDPERVRAERKKVAALTFVCSPERFAIAVFAASSLVSGGTHVAFPTLHVLWVPVMCTCAAA